MFACPKCQKNYPMEEVFSKDAMGRPEIICPYCDGYLEEHIAKLAKIERKKMKAERIEKQKAEKRDKEHNFKVKLINKALMFYGDMMGETAAQYHEDEGGIEGVISGSFELSKDEIHTCMCEALNSACWALNIDPFLDDWNFNIGDIANEWMKREYY